MKRGVVHGVLALHRRVMASDLNAAWCVNVREVRSRDILVPSVNMRSQRLSAGGYDHLVRTLPEFDALFRHGNRNDRAKGGQARGNHGYTLTCGMAQWPFR